MKTKYESLTEKKCDLCGKNFIPTFHWLYKIKKSGKKTLYFCSYSCYRKMGGDNSETFSTNARNRFKY